MLTPDYQEFANRAGRATPWQYRDLRNWHGQNLPKSAQRCAFATPKTSTKAEPFPAARANPASTAAAALVALNLQA